MKDGIHERSNHEGNYNVLPDSPRKLSFRLSEVSGQHYSAVWVSEFLFHCLVAADGDFAIFHPIAFKTLSLILNNTAGIYTYLKQDHNGLILRDEYRSGASKLSERISQNCF